MTEKEIIDILFKKYDAVKHHKNSQHACFSQFLTATGFKTKRYIDFYAVSYYGSMEAVAFEIKVSRADFLHDVNQFEDKQRDALNASTMFYYVVPDGLIQLTEVPDQAGLMVVQKSGRLVRKKIAPHRKLKYTADLLQAFLYQQMRITPRTTVHCQYEGQLIDAQQLDLEIQERVETAIRAARKSLDEDKERIKSRVQRSYALYLDFQKLAEGLHIGWEHLRRESVDDQYQKICSILERKEELEKQLKELRMEYINL